MLITPYGKIIVSVDGKAVDYIHKRVMLNQACSDVDGRFHLTYHYVSDGKPHIIKCALDQNVYPSYPETGERLECMAFYCNDGKMSIGCEASFGYAEGDGYDYDGYLEKDGISITTTTLTKNRSFVFSVCWIDKCTEMNDVQTWYGADPSGVVILGADKQK